MRKAIVKLLFVLFLIPVSTQAKVWRVNNNPGVLADFTTIDAAMAAYSAGDTIHLEPSSTSYLASATTLYTSDKFVTIIGNGYFLNNTGNSIGNLGLQQNELQSAIYSLTNVNGANSVNVNSNIKFIGIVFNDRVTLLKLGTSSLPKSVHDVIFQSCYFAKGVFYWSTSNDGNFPDQTNNLYFLNNYFEPNTTISGINLNGYSVARGTFFNNLIIENNIMSYVYCGQNLTQQPINPLQLVVRNNIICNDAQCQDGTSYWANNIFLAANADPGINSTHVYGTIFKNNVFGAHVIVDQGTAVDNLYDIDMSTVFKSVVQPYVEKNFQLNDGSPAIGAGVPNVLTQVDCGAFGGPNPYKLSGIPAVPSIYELQVPSTVNSGTDMHIILKSRSNN